MRHVRTTAVGAGVVLLLAGCSSSTSKPAAAPASQTPAANTAAPPAFSSSSTADDGLTGLGAPRDYWDSHRNIDGDSPAISPAYGPDPALPPLNGRVGDRYTVVQNSDGYIASYQVNFRPGIGINAALADILHTELPADAVREWNRTVADGCYQAGVKSATLAKSLSKVKLGDGSGRAFVEFRSLPTGGQEGYDPRDVTFAMVSLMEYAKADDAPGC